VADKEAPTVGPDVLTWAADARVAPGHEQELRHFVNESPWYSEPIERVLWDKADEMLGGEAAVLIIDDTALPKRATPRSA
jgi:SRSO17 transposase